MKITQIRNATQIITYAGKTFLIDPMLAKQGSYPGFPGTPNAELRNPLVELPLDVNTILDVDVIIVTHTHPDHWDDAAVALVPKDKQIYVQNESDAQLLRSQGFSQLAILSDQSRFGDISLLKTGGQHGSDEAYANPQMAERLGEACGVVFRHPQEQTLYLVGDTIWTDEIDDNLKKHHPDVVILNAGFAEFNGLGAIIMGAEDVLKTHQVLPDAQIVATHLEALNHCTLSRKELNDYVDHHSIREYVSVPADGETVIF